jgi:alkylation response protein AidB-like acyl-CoA dehydrogenase
MEGSTTKSTDVTHEEIVARATALVPFLREKATETEQNRSMLPEIHNRLNEAGLLGIMLAPGLGGLGMSLPTHLEAVMETARGCGSTAWLHSLIGNQNYLVGWYPPAAQEEVRVSGEPLFTCLVMGATITADKADGGVRLTGSWPYVSGVDRANWLMLSAHDPDDPKRNLTCLIPRASVSVKDDWNCLGMKGTGSKTVSLDDEFVPDHRVLCFREAEQNGIPGSAINDGLLYKTSPNSTVFAFVVAAPAVGLAECAIEAYRARLKSRTNARMPSAQSEWASSQQRLGRARAQCDIAKATVLDSANELMGKLEQGERISAEDRVRYRMAMVEIVRICSELVYELFCDAGTGVMMEGSELQRAFRDIHVLRSHFVILPEFATENAGRMQLGLNPTGPFV